MSFGLAKELLCDSFADLIRGRPQTAPGRTQPDLVRNSLHPGYRDERALSLLPLRVVLDLPGKGDPAILDLDRDCLRQAQFGLHRFGSTTDLRVLSTTPDQKHKD